jgi:hypothetical protein
VRYREKDLKIAQIAARLDGLLDELYEAVDGLNAILARPDAQDSEERLAAP